MLLSLVSLIWANPLVSPLVNRVISFLVVPHFWPRSRDLAFWISLLISLGEEAL
jgi:hypothetical protein